MLRSSSLLTWSVVMDRACFLAMLFTSTLGIVLVAVGHVFVESPAETACKQLIRMLGADTPAFRHGPPCCTKQAI